MLRKCSSEGTGSKRALGTRRREEEVEGSRSSDHPLGHESELSRGEWGSRETIEKDTLREPKVAA